MSAAATRTRWSWDEYMTWEALQPTKNELVDGRVVAMVGSTARHDVICNNLRRELGNQLRLQRCRVQGPDLKLRIGDNARYPDALIDCGAFAGDALLAQEPVAVFEVLSKSTAWIDQTLKLRDYDHLGSIRYYVLISQDEPRILAYTRAETGSLDTRAAQLLEGLAATLTLSDPVISIPFTTLYEGLELS